MSHAGLSPAAQTAVTRINEVEKTDERKKELDWAHRRTPAAGQVPNAIRAGTLRTEQKRAEVGETGASYFVAQTVRRSLTTPQRKVVGLRRARSDALPADAGAAPSVYFSGTSFVFEGPRVCYGKAAVFSAQLGFASEERHFNAS